jgi:hypothetical protein
LPGPPDWWNHMMLTMVSAGSSRSLKYSSMARHARQSGNGTTSDEKSTKACSRLETDVDLAGFDLNVTLCASQLGLCGSVLYADSVEACCDACRARAKNGCRFFTWKPDDGTCYLKTSDNGRHAWPGHMSGVLGS